MNERQSKKGVNELLPCTSIFTTHLDKVYEKLEAKLIDHLDNIDRQFYMRSLGWQV